MSLRKKSAVKIINEMPNTIHSNNEPNAPIQPNEDNFIDAVISRKIKPVEPHTQYLPPSKAPE